MIEILLAYAVIGIIVGSVEYALVAKVYTVHGLTVEVLGCIFLWPLIIIMTIGILLARAFK